MSIFSGYTLLIATVSVAAMLSGCGQAKRPAPLQRAPTMDVSLVVAVEYFDTEESPKVEEVPVVAKAPASEPPPLASAIRIAGEIPPAAEAPAITEFDAEARSPPDEATPAVAETPTDTEPRVDAGVPLIGKGVPFPTETRVAAGMLVAVTIPAAVDWPDSGEKSRVFFGFDSAEIQDDQRAMIGEWSDWLKAHPGWALKIEGHTDGQGPCLYNRWLGQQRANAARDILVKQGVDASRLLTVSFGEDRPAIPGASRAERVKNRRVRVEPMPLSELASYAPDISSCTQTVAAKPENAETRQAPLFRRHPAHRGRMAMDTPAPHGLALRDGYRATSPRGRPLRESAFRHCEAQRAAAIQLADGEFWIAASASPPRNDGGYIHATSSESVNLSMLAYSEPAFAGKAPPLEKVQGIRR